METLYDHNFYGSTAVLDFKIEHITGKKVKEN